MQIQYMYKDDVGKGNRYGKGSGVPVYLASEVDARIAELKWCLQEAMEWNWMEPDLPADLIERCEAALKL